MEKIFVISLPRTGTSSVTYMGDLTGFVGVHSMGPEFKDLLYGDLYNFFSDTPVFSPSVIEKICKDSTIKSKFIFIEKDLDLLYQSWVKMKLDSYYNQWYDVTICKMNSKQCVNFLTYKEVFNNELLTSENYKKLFENHRNIVLNLVTKYNKDLLLYDFKDGWGSFCEFLNVDVPNIDLPHLNKETFLDYNHKFNL